MRRGDGIYRMRILERDWKGEVVLATTIARKGLGVVGDHRVRVGV